mgnify:CR=1 FL=1
MSKQNLQPLIYALLIITGILIGTEITKKQSNNQNEKINNIINLIETHYVDTVDTKQIQESLINSILTDLDPHSTYINAENFTSIEEDMQGSFSGIGIQFNIINDTIIVIAAISGGPSEKLGIISGDRIINVENENVASIKIKNQDVINKLRGEKGSIVNVTIYRPEEKRLLQFSIKRDDIPLYSIDVSMMLKEDIGYIKLNRFSATTYNEFKKAINKLIKKEMKKLILDLRGNPGGYLGMAISICDEILNEDHLIVYTEGRNRKRENIYATTNGELKSTEIVVIIDEGSASASEIVAGAIQDNDRGIIIGRKSFGKGLVQEQINLDDGSVVRLTTQRYYTPSGRCIQKKYNNNKQDTVEYNTKEGRNVYAGGGISPDVLIKYDKQLDYSQINFILSQGWIREYAINKSLYFKKKREFNSEKQFIETKNTKEIYNEFLLFIKEKDSNLKLNSGSTETAYLQTLLKASIARNIFGEESYYQILNEKDIFIQEAILHLN